MAMGTAIWGREVVDMDVKFESSSSRWVVVWGDGAYIKGLARPCMNMCTKEFFFYRDLLAMRGVSDEVKRVSGMLDGWNHLLGFG